MRRISQGVAAAVALLSAGTAAAKDLEIDRVVAVVNHDVILHSELERRVVQATVTKKAADPRRAMLWAMIDELLVVQLAMANGITATDAEVDRAIAEIRRNANLTDEQLIAELDKQGYSLSDYRVTVRRELMSAKMLNFHLRPDIEVSDAQVKALYDARVKAAEGAQIPPLDDVKDELRKELYLRELDRSRDRMIQMLRAQAFVDVRLPPGPAAAAPASEAKP